MVVTCTIVIDIIQGLATPIYTALAAATAVKMAVNGQTEYFLVINGQNQPVKIVQAVHVTRGGDVVSEQNVILLWSLVKLRNLDGQEFDRSRGCKHNMYV